MSQTVLLVILWYIVYVMCNCPKTAVSSRKNGVSDYFLCLRSKISFAVLPFSVRASAGLKYSYR